MPRPTNTEARRQQIVEGMARVVARQGYDGASIAEIAEAAGLTAGLVHYHFETKQEIFIQLVETLGNALQKRLQERLEEAGPSPGARLHGFIDVHLALGPDASPQTLACWVNIGAEAIRQEPVRAAYRRAIEADLQLLEQLVRDCLAERGASTRHARALAAGLFAAIEGYFVLSAAEPALVPAGSAARTVRLMADGLIANAT